MSISIERFSALRERYGRARDGFDAVVAAVPAERWDGPSACSLWTNRDVLGHAVWGQQLVRHLAIGAPFTDRTGAPGAPHPARLIAGDAVATWRDARAGADRALTDEALAREVHLPPFGDIPLAGFVTALVADFLAHAWDIGSAVGMDVRLDATLLPGAMEWARRTIVARGPGGVGPELAPVPPIDEQARFLAFMGRGGGAPVA